MVAADCPSSRHLQFEEEVAAILDINHAEVQEAVAAGKRRTVSLSD
jgi:hypothetical protein